MKNEFQVTYFLWKDRKNKDGVPVYIRSKQNSDKQISYNTGLSILNPIVNKKTGGLTIGKNKPLKLVELEQKLKETYKALIAKGYSPTLNDLITHLDEYKRPQSHNIIEWCDDYLSNSHFSEGKKKAVKTLKSNIMEWDEKATFQNFDFDKFISHLTDNMVANNSQYKRLRALQLVAAHAKVTIPSYRLDTSKKRKNSEKVRIEYDQVKQIEVTETISEIEKVAKDVFLIACYSGLRISDILNLPEGTLHDNYYETLQVKTDKPVFVTLHELNTPLIRKYNLTGVRYSRQKMSAALKDILERAGLTQEVTRAFFVGEKVIRRKKPLYKEIAFHTGRNFYARFLSDLGLSHEIVRDELGHDYKDVTSKYMGSQNHKLRIAKVKLAIQKRETTLKEMQEMLNSIA